MLYLIDFIFSAQKRIATLPKWHGPRWSALLRHICARAGLVFDDIVLGILPMRNGQIPVNERDQLRLRLIMPYEAFSTLPKLASAFSLTGIFGEFSPQSLKLIAIIDSISKNILYIPGQGLLADPEPFDARTVKVEMEHLSALESWSLEFISPLRLPLPAGHLLRKQHHYSPPQFFASPDCLANLVSRIRFPDVQKNDPLIPSELAVDNYSLHWEDMRYNANRQMALGGITGRMEFRGRAGSKLAQYLAIGQYVGAGKNGRFGLGYWRLPELDCLRKIDLPK